jgi:hypothetical protein
MTFYTESIADAKELIEEAGRSTILRQNTNVTAEDALQPWDGVGTTNLDTTVIGVFLNYHQKYFNQTLVRMGDQQLLLAASSLDTIVPNLRDTIVDGTDIWKVVDIMPLKPGAEVIMYTLLIRK